MVRSALNFILFVLNEEFLCLNDVVAELDVVHLKVPFFLLVKFNVTNVNSE